MTVHDDDILDFDFVDDETRELASPTSRPSQRQPGGGSRGGGGGRRRPQLRAPSGIAPLLRLAGLVVLAIAVVVLLAVWVQGCAGTEKEATYGDYLADVRSVATDSAKVGADLATLLTTPGLAQTALETRLGGLVQRQELDVARARDLDPPGPLTPSHEQAIESLELRVAGIQGMLDTFRATKDAEDQADAGRRLALMGQRLEASDVVWADLFLATSTASMAAEGVQGLTAPASVFVQNVDLFTSRSLSAIWQRVHGASTGGTASGLHGSQLAYTEVNPAGVQLTTSTETKITISTDLTFEVGVQNSGENQEVGVKVELTIPAGDNPIEKTATIDVIDPEETKTVTFSDFPDFPFGENTTVQVSVQPVPGETRTDNNSAEYPVVFTLEPT